MRIGFPAGLGSLVVWLCVFSAATLCAQYDGAEPPPQSLAPGFDSITAEECRQWLNVLAGPGFEGRGTGQEGHVKAAHWIAGKCAEFGLKPMGDAGTYFQMLPMGRLIVVPEQSKLSGPNDLSIAFSKAIGLDRFSDQAETTGQVVFLRMMGPNAKLDAELPLRDKVVILVADEATASGSTFSGLLRRRPAAVLRVIDAEPVSTSQLQRPEGRQRSSGLSGTITRQAALDVLEAAGGEDSWLEPCQADSVLAHETSLEVKLEVRVREEPTAVPNVLAWQPGSDPHVQDEYLVLGAHLDHLGIRGTSVYPGADDNGSGSTAVLSIAKAVSLNPEKPKRGILFMWFAAEEIGLVGSAHYVANPTLPLDKMICMLNIDMVGRNEEKGNESAADNERTLHLVGSRKGDLSLHDIVLQANQSVKLDFEYDEEGVFSRSDHINFFKKGTSIAFLFGGFHPDYHRTSDAPQKINYEKISAAARLYYLTCFLAADHGPFPIPPAEGEAGEEKTESKQ